MSRDSSRNVHWTTRVATGESSFGPGLSFVQKLAGVIVRCPKCHQVAGILYRSRLVWVDGVEYHLRCRSCHEKSYIRTRSSLVGLLTDALPASDAEDLLKERAK
jgi:hypothetical protein